MSSVETANAAMSVDEKFALLRIDAAIENFIRGDGRMAACYDDSWPVVVSATSPLPFPIKGPERAPG